jgi:DNA-binding NarL/FixJ family response regulator
MPSKSLQLLLIEDSPSDARYIELMLGRMGKGEVSVTRSERLDSALARFDCDNFDLVLLDLSLPDSHWIETLATLRRAWSAVPVVVLTGFDDRRLAGHSIQHGASAFLVKGKLNADSLKKAIHSALPGD